MRTFPQFKSVDWRRYGITQVTVSNPELMHELLEEADLGESAAIAYCLEHGADLLLVDDEAGRMAATARSIRIIGTVGILLRAKDAGHIPLIRPLMNALEDIKFYIAADLFRRVLQLAGE